MGKPLARIFVIGLDAYDKDLAARWAAEGKLPNIAKLHGVSVETEVENPRGLDAGVVWPCFQTGVTPARHGQFEGVRQFDSENYVHRFMDPDETSNYYFWNHLTKHNKRSCYVDAPYVHFPGAINGMAVWDWGTHSESSGHTQLILKTHPPELADEIKERFWPDPLERQLCDNLRPKKLDEIKWYYNGILKRIEMRIAMNKYLLDKGDWDFFQMVFPEAHSAGHHLWFLHDENHPDHDAETRAALGFDPLLKIYQAIDDGVGDLWDYAGEESVTLCYLSHGMGPEYSGTRMLDRMLAALDGQKTTDYKKGSTNMLRSAWRSLPEGMRRKLKPMQRRAWNKVYNDGFQPNREGRRFFEVYLNNRSAGVRLNVIGREKHGKISREDYDKVIAELDAELREFINVETNEPLVVDVVPVQDLFEHKGERLEHLPDVAVTWNTNAPINKVWSPKTGEIVNEHLSHRTGDHRPVGKVFVRGPGLEPRLMNGRINVLDFVPTFCEILNIPQADSDGEPVEVLTGVPNMQAAE
ncbi:MAG: alkaline phosphatase family protein [Pseudomonadota bacterium]